jgi:hypothetical protein
MPGVTHFHIKINFRFVAEWQREFCIVHQTNRFLLKLIFLDRGWLFLKHDRQSLG